MPKSKKIVSKRRTVLVTRFSALGDVAMTLPAIYDVSTANPEVRFVFLTRPHPAKMFIRRPANLEVISVDFSKYKGAAGMWRLARELRRKYGVTDFVDLHDVLRTKLLRVFMQMAGVRVNHIEKDRRGRRLLTRTENKILRPLKPMPLRYREAFEQAGFTLSRDFKSLFGAQHGPTADFAAVTSPKKDGERWIAVAPFAQHQGKVYPLKSLEKVIEGLSNQKDTKLFIFGFGEQETSSIEGLAIKYPGVVNMSKAALGLSAELSLLSWCDVMLSMDSANMHLASLVGLRTVSVWGATHPFAGFLGVNQNPEDAVQLDLPCRPCSIYGNRPCAFGDYRCMTRISPETIIMRINQQN